MRWLVGEQRTALHVPGKVVDSTGGGQDSGPARGKCDPDQARARYHQGGLAVRADLNNPAFARQGSGDVEVTAAVECQPLRASQSAIEGRNVSLGVDLVNAIE